MMQKKHLWPALPALALIALNLLVACNEQQSAAPPVPAPPRATPVPPPDTIPRAVVLELEKRVTVERELRAKSESRLDKEEAAKGRGQNIALLMSPGAVVLLVIGTVLGSRARHESQQ